mgnify:CR=1 FL=1
MNVGDEIVIPGGDLFSKAITKLWGQNYFSDVEIFITKLEDKNIVLFDVQKKNEDATEDEESLLSKSYANVEFTPEAQASIISQTENFICFICDCTKRKKNC